MEPIRILGFGVPPKIYMTVRSLGRWFARGADLWLAGGLIVFGVYFFSGYFTSVLFDRERIEIRVEPGRIIVAGLYHYLNSSRLPAVLSLRVPFPVDGEHPPPGIYTLSEARADGRVLRQIRSVDRDGKVAFRLIFRPGEGKWVRLSYVQPTRVPNGRYILKTTRAWRHPLAQGEYVLRLPRELELAFSNYPLALTPPARPWKVYGFSAVNFWPDRDWEFSWGGHAAMAQPSSKEVVCEAQRTRRLPAGMVPIVRPAGSIRQ
ncbi:MAG: hypothetical protein LAP13_23075 [Acidobacteriia bacterium]|nr:hypothetical protein [Terriglobia bacterium]